MPSPASVEPAEVYAALSEVGPRLSALVRSIKEPTAHAIGNWNTVEVAVHVAQVWENLTSLADHEIESPLHDIGSLGSLTEGLVEQDTDRDPAELAERIDLRVAAFLSQATALHSDAPSP